MARQRLSRAQIKTSLLGTTVLSNAYLSTSTTATEWTNSRVTATTESAGMNLEVVADIGISLNTSSTWAQGVVEIWYSYNGGAATLLTRRVPVRGAPTNYAGSGDMYSVVENVPAGTHVFYVMARLSSNATSMGSDPSSIDRLTVKAI